MKNKMTLAGLLLIVGALFSFLRAPEPKQSSMRASAALLPAGSIGCRITTQSLNAEPEVGAPNRMLQSKDGGQSWQDISNTLPGKGQPEDFFVAGQELYLRMNDEMYASKRNDSPSWERDMMLDPRCDYIGLNGTGVIAYSNQGHVYQKMPGIGSWLLLYSRLSSVHLRSLLETSDGSIFWVADNGIFKSVDKGKSWKHVYGLGWVMELVESEGVLVGTSEKGIIRSADNGEHWELVISEGGVGIDVEKIEGGFAAIAFSTKTESRKIHLSFDKGLTWHAVDAGLKPSLSLSSIKQVGSYLICGHPDGIFRSSDMGKTWMKVYNGLQDKDNDDRVFEVFVSGNVLYAIAKNFGC